MQNADLDFIASDNFSASSSPRPEYLRRECDDSSQAARQADAAGSNNAIQLGGQAHGG